MFIRNAHLLYFPAPLGADLEIKRGKSILLLGNSGCGKTSLLKAIAGFSDLKKGEIDAGAKRVAMLLQNPFHQIIMQKVHDELYFPLKNVGKSREEADIEIKKVSEDLQIQHLLDRDISTLSFGETQLVMIAATCLTEADIILMDEPTSHLDPPSVKIFYTCVKNMAKAGKSVLVTSQAPDEYIFIDMVYVMEQGVIKAQMAADTCPEALFEQGVQLDSLLTDIRLKELAGK
jgi:energy-coupling factor transporter ATP-binding protein EcfA2